MSLRGFVRILSFTNSTSFSQSLIPIGISQNDTLLNSTSAIPELSATADTFGDPGFIRHIPVGLEAVFVALVCYMYVHLYIGSPCKIYRELRQQKQQKPTDTVILLDDHSSVASRNSTRSIDWSILTHSSNTDDIDPVQLTQQTQEVLKIIREPTV